MKRVLILLLISFFLIASDSCLYAQDEPATASNMAAEDIRAIEPAAAPEAAAPVEDLKFTGGTVVSVSKDTGFITVNEYDIDTDTEINVTYAVNQATEVKGAAAWTEMPVNSYVDIEYVLDAAGQKVAKYLGVYSEEETAVE